MGIYFKASCLKIFWAVQMIKIVFACHQFQQTKTALIHVDHIVPAIKKECLKHQMIEILNVFMKLLVIMGWDGWKEMGIQYCPWAIL